MTDMLDMNRKVILIKDSKIKIISVKLHSLWEKLQFTNCYEEDLKYKSTLLL